MGTQEDDVGSKTSSYSWEAWGGERTLQPTNTFFLGWVGFFLRGKTNLLLHTDIGQGKSNCGKMMNLGISSQVLKQNKQSIEKKWINFLSFYLSLCTLEHHCYINRKDKTNILDLFVLNMWIISLFWFCCMVADTGKIFSREKKNLNLTFAMILSLTLILVGMNWS